MPKDIKHALALLLLSVLFAGCLSISGQFTDPGILKAPLMLISMVGLAFLYLNRLRPSPGLLIFLLFWLYGYFHITRTGSFEDASLMQVGILLAFLLGYLHAPLAHRRLVPLVVLLCVARGLMDIVTLVPLGSDSSVAFISQAAASTYNVTSFFLDKTLFGGMLILGAFHHFYLMEKGEPHKPVQVLLYTSSLLVLMSILLVDSRLVMGVFFLSFLPLMFLSLRLDGREPRLERLAWITGITLALGIAWINLPDIQLHKMASALTDASVGFLPWAWKSAWHTFTAAPIFGWGLGDFRFAAVPFEGAWPIPTGEVLPIFAHAGNHSLEALAEGGLVGFILEAILIAGALFGCARLYYQTWHLEAKYVFFSLVALLLLAQFSTLLEQAPARFAFWALIGYGWSLLAQSSTGKQRLGFSLQMPRLSPTALSLAGGALLALTCLHLWMRVPELWSDRLYAKALQVSDTNGKVFTDLVVDALGADPGNEAANMAYLGILTDFHREEEAVKHVGRLHYFAPDARKEAVLLARIYISFERYDSAAKYASQVLEAFPRFLPALEILVESQQKQMACGALDSLRDLASQWNDAYPLPAPKGLSIQGLDSLFRSNQEVIFLQRWFGGQALRRRFVETRLDRYNRRGIDHERLRSLQEAHCSLPGEETGDGAVEGKTPPAKAKSRRFFRGWGKVDPPAIPMG